MKIYIFLVGVKYGEYMKQRPHHMADYLASKGNKVLYIGIDSEKKVFGEEEFERLFVDKEQTDLLTEIKPNLFTLPFVVRKSNKGQNGMDEFISKMELFYGSENAVFYVGHPVWTEYLNKLSPRTKVIYDCMDDWEEFTLELGFGKQSYIYDERKLAGISDIVITSAKKLYVKMSNYAKNIYYLPNGVRTKDYNESKYIPDDLKSIKQPIVFFMGTITGWVDLELMDYIAEERPEYSFVYVGNIVEVKKEDVPLRDNIYYLGKKEYSELVHYLKQARVAIIPFKENRLTASVSPLKFYEYISAGVPVVSTMFPDLLGVEGAYIASNSSEFVEALDYYIRMDDENYKELQKRLYETSLRFEWGYMMDKFLVYLEKDVDKNISSRAFIVDTIEYYKSFSDNDLIKNELLTMYNALDRFKDAVVIGEKLRGKNINFDLEQLALAYYKTGKVKEATELLKELISTNERYSIYTYYINNLFLHKNSVQLLEVFLLKVCNRFYEAVSLCENIKESNHGDVFINAMLASLYYEIGEYDISVSLFATTVDGISGEDYETTFSPELLINMVDYSLKHALFDQAENLGLALYTIGLQELATKKLGEIYYAKAFLESDRFLTVNESYKLC